MQVACGRCDASYVVDDRLITAHGVRAQCPGCRHMQRVSRTGVEALRQPGPPPPAITPAQLPALPSSARLVQQVPIVSPPSAASVPLRKALHAPRKAQAVLQSVSPGGGLQVSHAPQRPPPPVPTAPELRVVPEPSAVPVISASPLHCRACSAPLEDLFDRALGICEACGVREASDGSLAARAADPMDDSATEPMVTTVPAPAPAHAVTAPSAGVQTAPTATVVHAVVSPFPKYAKWLLVASGMAVIAGVGAVGMALGSRAWPAGANAAPSPLPPELEAVLPKWRMAHPQLIGGAAEKVERARELLARDRTREAVEARDLFQEAVLVDPASDAAIAGYVRAVVRSRGRRIDSATYDEALALIELSARRSARDPDVLLAHAQLLLCRADRPEVLTEARALAEEAAGKAQNAKLRAEALYVVGRTWQPVSSELALKQFDDALTLNPELRAAWFERALAHERTGHHGRALQDLQRRLAIDPDHWPSNRELARMHQETGRSREARAIYEQLLQKDPEAHRAKLALAVLGYQVEDRLEEALTTLRGMAKRLDAVAEPEQLEVLTHLAAAERIAGHLSESEAAATRALAVDPSDVAAHLQLFLLEVERGAPGPASRHLERLTGGLGDPALAKVLEGRLRLLEEKWDEAIAAFSAAAELDDRRVDAQLLAGIAAVSAGRRDVAITHLSQVLRWDPVRPLPEGAGPRRWVDPVWLIRGFEGRFQRLPASTGDVLPNLYEGVYRYLLGEVGTAARLFAQVIDKDDRNVPALSWRTFALLKLGETARAASMGARAAAVGRGHALAHYADGAALSAQGRERDARRALAEAIRLEPGLLGAEERLAQLDVLQGDPASGRERLTRIVSREPAWYSAKRLLYALEKENAGEGAGRR